MTSSSHHTGDRDEAADVLSGSQLTVDVEHKNDAVVVRVTGEIDLLTAPRVEETIMPLIRQQPPVLVVDLSGVTFLASAGLKLLVAAQQASREGTRIRVVADDQHTFRPIEMTGLTESIAVYGTVADALNVE
ncbi:STAS domain-containing protein [Haloechinothrix salitolerans]|uniref:Anti-sigma factor antagonist n=1 Tax=Haloechinothrix salitolerans TaxID=926830 RepID=A0ABW2C8A5_9PSEU